MYLFSIITVIGRRCGDGPAPNKCSVMTLGAAEVTICSCDQDFCNSANGLLSPKSSLLVIALLVLQRVYNQTLEVYQGQSGFIEHWQVILNMWEIYGQVWTPNQDILVLVYFLWVQHIKTKVCAKLYFQANKVFPLLFITK